MNKLIRLAYLGKRPSMKKLKKSIERAGGEMSKRQIDVIRVCDMLCRNNLKARTEKKLMNRYMSIFIKNRKSDVVHLYGIRVCRGIKIPVYSASCVNPFPVNKNYLTHYGLNLHPTIDEAMNDKRRMIRMQGGLEKDLKVFYWREEE